MPRLYCIQGGSYIFSWVKCLHIIFSSILFSLHFFFSAPCLSCSLHTVQPTENVTNTIDCSYFSGAIHGMLVQCLRFCLHFPRFYSYSGRSKVVQKIFRIRFPKVEIKKNSTTTLLIWKAPKIKYKAQERHLHCQIWNAFCQSFRNRKFVETPYFIVIVCE